MDEISPICEVLLLDEKGRTKFCYLSHWVGRRRAIQSVLSFAPVPYHRYEIWCGSTLIAARAKGDIPVAVTFSLRPAA